MRSFAALVCLFVSLHASLVIADDNPFICDPQLEGMYDGTLGTFPVRVNIFCVDSEHIAATVCTSVLPDGKFTIDMATSLSNFVVHKGELILANFLLGNKDRRSGSSKSIVSYMHIDLAALSEGKLTGKYLSSAMTDFFPLNGMKVNSFPHLEKAVSLPLDGDSVIGTYRTDMPAELGKPTNVIFDVLDGTPVISLVRTGVGTTNHFTDGPPWDETGVFSSSTAEGNGGEPDDKKMFSIRGHFLDETHLEFYLITPMDGLKGPFKAYRLDSKVPLS
jgi:hypothetical protein